MTIDTHPLIAAAAPVLVAGINSLSVGGQRAVDEALGDGARVELRIGVCDGQPTVSLWLCNLDGDAKELGRLDTNGN